MKKSALGWLAWGGTVCSALSVGLAAEAKSGAPETPDGTALRLARSQDGLRFTETGGLFLRQASGPDLTTLSDGHVMALFDQPTPSGVAGSTRISFSVSEDGGTSWSPARPIRFGGRPSQDFAGRHADLVQTADGRFRLYCVGGLDGSTPPARTGRARRLCSAVSRDGRLFRLDTMAKTPPARGFPPVVVRIGSEIHLFLADARPASASRALHFVSRDGRRFASLASSATPHVEFVGSIVQVNDSLRAYVSSPLGIRSLTSTDGRTWTMDAGIRVRGGRDPAVTRLSDGSYLMLYCAAATRTDSQEEELAGGIAGGAAIGEASGSDDAMGGGVDGAIAGRLPIAVPPWSSPTGPDNLTADRFITFLAAGRERGSDQEPAASDGARLTLFGDWSTVLEDLADSGLPPPPDFSEPVDYVQWYSDVLLGHPFDNAFEVYATFLPGPWAKPGDMSEWPKLRNMISDRGRLQAPIPWSPDDHPAWAASRREALDLLAGFREAATHSGFAQPVYFSDDWPTKDHPQRRLLIEMTLPSLSAHRQMAQAMMAEAWRVEDGQVSPARMLNAMKTTLRGAGHICQGSTIIEQLVGESEQRLVQRSALRALELDVFSEDELQSALDLLEKHDRDSGQLPQVMWGEYAVTADMMQFLFMPEGDGEPRLNHDNVRYVAEHVIDTDPEPLIDALDPMGPDDVRQAMRDIRAYHAEIQEQMKIGYPAVRSADLHATWERFAATSPVLGRDEVLFTDVSRVAQVHAKTEASRRATQLSYALHLFKARHGRWPDRLSELPDGYGRDMRIDPFTGREFAYRLTPDGPQLYTLSENGIDDGGLHNERLSQGPDDAAASDDYVYWPPQWEE